MGNTNASLSKAMVYGTAMAAGAEFQLPTKEQSFCDYDGSDEEDEFVWHPSDPTTESFVDDVANRMSKGNPIIITCIPYIPIITRNSRNSRNSRKVPAWKDKQIDPFADRIPCVHQDPDGCDYKLMRVGEEKPIGFICKEHMHEYVQYINLINLDRTRSGVDPLDKRDVRFHLLRPYSGQN